MDTQKIKEALAKQPNAYPSMIAQELGVSELAVVSQLPEDTVKQVAVGEFDKIMDEVTQWGDVLFLVRNGSVIAEVKGPIPKGNHSHGYFNLHGASPIGGHIHAESLGAICFVGKLVSGSESISIQFYDKSGNGMFKIYLGRGADRKILTEQKEKYDKLKDELEAI